MQVGGLLEEREWEAGSLPTSHPGAGPQGFQARLWGARSENQQPGPQRKDEEPEAL